VDPTPVSNRGDGPGGRRQIAWRIRGLLRGATLAVTSVAVVLAGAELALRWRGYPFRGTWIPSETALATFDDELGWSYIPGLTKTQPFGTDRHRITMYFDSSGIRVDRPGHVWKREAPSVLFIGDSFTMGQGVEYEDAFPARVEALAGGRVQAVNLGVQGYGTDQSLLFLEREIGRFDTRAVVYTFIADHIRRNDNYDRRVLYPQGTWPGTKPLFGVRSDGGIFLRKRPRRYADMHTLRLTQVAQLAWARWGPAPDTALTTALIREMKRLCDEKGVPLLVVSWAWVPRPGDHDVFKGTGVDLLNLGDSVPEGWRSWRIPGDGHPTVQGHDRAARLIVRRLSSVLPDVVGPP
jgi:hypothetical protein